jgi:hypothetical protein
MSERRGAYVVFAVGLGLFACETENVSVDSEGEALNLARCWGTDCERVRSEPIKAASFGRCDLPPERALDLEWERELCGKACDPERLVAAPDGTAWVLGMSQRGARVLVLSHYAVDGSPLGEAEVTTISNPNALVESDLACDQRGHCYVIWYTLYAETADSELIQAAAVQEFDVRVAAVGQPVALTGVAQPLVSGGAAGKVAVAGPASSGAHRGSLAVLDAGTLLFTQNNVDTYGRLQGVGIAGMATDSEGRIAVLAQRDAQIAGSSRFAITRFDAGGKPVWDRTIAAGFDSGVPAVLVGDDAGNVTMAGFLPPADPSGGHGEFILLHHLDADGRLRWAYELHWGSLDLAVDAPSGRIFALSNANASEPQNYKLREFGMIEEITNEGTSCRRYTYEYSDYLASYIAVGRSDDIYQVIERRLRRYTGIGPSNGDGKVVVPTQAIPTQALDPR